MSWKSSVYLGTKLLIGIILIISAVNYYDFQLHPIVGDGSAIKDDVLLSTYGPYVTERFFDSTGETHESGVGWEFISMQIGIRNHNDGDASVFVSYIEDESGLRHYPYIVDGHKGQINYSSSQSIELDGKEAKSITVVYKVPTNTDPSIFHYRVATPHSYRARDKIYFKKNILDHLV